jgi:hypothetical protein
MLQNSLPALPTLGEAEAAGNTYGVNVDEQLVGESAGDEWLSDVHLPNIPHADANLDSSAGKK